jgi:hypothetical protein
MWLRKKILYGRIGNADFEKRKLLVTFVLIHIVKLDYVREPLPKQVGHRNFGGILSSRRHGGKCGRSVLGF